MIWNGRFQLSHTGWKNASCSRLWHRRIAMPAAQANVRRITRSRKFKTASEASKPIAAASLYKRRSGVVVSATFRLETFTDRAFGTDAPVGPGSAFKFGLNQNRTNKIGAEQIGAAQIRIEKTGLGQIGQ